jgi:hypothetical protein
MKSLPGWHSRLPLFVRAAMSRRLLLILILTGFASALVGAQVIQPVITEYTGKADGKFEVTNDTLVPMAVVLEPRSFNIQDDGKGVFRPLDAATHLQLSTTSFRLEPKQSYFVFYKARADSLPAWFTVYAVFSPIAVNDGVKVRVMLPHTVYLYQKSNISKESVHVTQASYDASKKVVSCDIENNGGALVRVQEVRTIAGKAFEASAGFPLLPGGRRHLSIDWKKEGEPDSLMIHFPHFDLRQAIVGEN